MEAQRQGCPTMFSGRARLRWPGTANRFLGDANGRIHSSEFVAGSFRKLVSFLRWPNILSIVCDWLLRVRRTDCGGDGVDRDDRFGLFEAEVALCRRVFRRLVRKCCLPTIDVWFFLHGLCVQLRFRFYRRIERNGLYVADALTLAP